MTTHVATLPRPRAAHGTCSGAKFRASAPCGVAVTTSTLRSCCPLPPFPRRPQLAGRPAKLAPGKRNPRHSRAIEASHAPRQRLPHLVFRVVPRPASSGVLGTPWCRASGCARREARPYPIFITEFTQPRPETNATRKPCSHNPDSALTGRVLTARFQLSGRIPSAPLVAAGIPPRSLGQPSPLHPPHPAALCGRVPRLSPPTTSAKGRAILFNHPSPSVPKDS